MTVPPMTDHGFGNTSGHDHVVPLFLDPYRCLDGGYFDVEPHPEQLARQKHPLESSAMNQSVFLERAIRRVVAATTNTREAIVPVERAGSCEIVGLELAITRVGKSGSELGASHYGSCRSSPALAVFIWATRKKK